MPQTDPVQILITQGYPPEVAKKMVESGAYEKMVSPGLLDFSQVGSVFGGTPATGQPVLPGLTGTQETEEISPELQAFLDQGYNMEEAQQLLASRTYGLGTTEPADGTKAEQAVNLLDFGAGLGGGVSMEQAAYGLGQSLGAESGPLKGVGVAAHAGKLAFGAARGIASGIGQAKRSGYVQEYYDKKKLEGDGRDTYTPAPQAGNVNYMGGQSFGEEGGIQGETLPRYETGKEKRFREHLQGLSDAEVRKEGMREGAIKAQTVLPLKTFLTNKGFTKPGFKKLL